MLEYKSFWKRVVEFTSFDTVSFAVAITQKSLDRFRSIRVSISFYGLECFLVDR